MIVHICSSLVQDAIMIQLNGVTFINSLIIPMPNVLQFLRKRLRIKKKTSNESKTKSKTLLEETKHLESSEELKTLVALFKIHLHLWMTMKTRILAMVDSEDSLSKKYNSKEALCEENDIEKALEERTISKDHHSTVVYLEEMVAQICWDTTEISIALEEITQCWAKWVEKE